MAAPVLRHFVAVVTINASNVGSATPTGRAYVGRCVIAALTATTVTVRVAGQPIVLAVSLSSGQTYEQAGVVMTAGEQMTTESSVASSAFVHLFVEEVDNA